MMRASDTTLDVVKSLAPSIPELGVVLSFIQVEEGLKELESHWEGFRDSSNYFNFTFDDERACASDFAAFLLELYGSARLTLE